MSAALSLPFPASFSLTRRQMPLALAIALHATVVLVLLSSLQPKVADIVTPREVVISLLPQRDASRPLPRPEPQVARPPQAAQPVPAVSPTPQPVAVPAPPAPAQRSVVSEAPAPATASATPAATAAPVASAPAADVKAAPAPAHSPAHPPAPAAATAEKVPMTVSSVEYLQPPKPEYPPMAKRAGEQGKVVLRVLVDEKGQPERVDVRDSAGYPKLDEAARQAVLRASFRPHLEDGRAVPVYVLVPISFNLR